MKSKVAAKTGGLKYQWEIMQGLNIPDDEIKKYVVHFFDLVTCVTSEMLNGSFFFNVDQLSYF